MLDITVVCAVGEQGFGSTNIFSRNFYVVRFEGICKVLLGTMRNSGTVSCTTQTGPLFYLYQFPKAQKSRSS